MDIDENASKSSEQQREGGGSSSAEKPQLSQSRDFVAGCFAGVFSTLVGHPFDTVKVRMQLNTTGVRQSMVGCTMLTIRQEGILGLYKGLSSPMMSVPLVNALVFGAYEHAKRQVQAMHPETPLSTGEQCLCGAWAGLVNTAVVTPVELLKCRLQVQGDQPSGVCAETRALAREYRTLVQQDGFKGLWRGNVITAIREVASYIAMFGTYEVLKAAYPQPGVEPSAAYTVFSGGVAGMMCWTFSYPQDVIKSHLQLQRGALDYSARYPAHRWFPDGGFISCFRTIMRSEGYRGFWHGYSAAAVRAFPANGAGFLAYEMVRKLFNRYDDYKAGLKQNKKSKTPLLPEINATVLSSAAARQSLAPSV